MQRAALGMLLTICLGLSTMTAISRPAQAGDEFEYRILGCSGPVDFTDPRKFFDVVFSSSPGDVGQPCEAVISALGAEGFRLIEVRASQVPPIGYLHYLQRRKKI